MEENKAAAGQDAGAPEKKRFSLKGSARALTHKKLFAIFAVLGAALLLLRVWQMLYVIDPETGFFANRSDPTVWLFYILTVGLMVAAPLCFYLAGDGTYTVLPVRRDPLHGAACLLVAAAAGWDAYTQFTAYRGGSSAGRLSLAFCVFAALSAAAMLWEALRFFIGKGSAKAGRLLRLAPALWMFFRTVSFFAITANYLYSSQLLLNIFGAAFLMLFFFHYARKTSAVEADDNTAAFCATGTVAAAFLFPAAVSALLLQAVRHTEGLYCDFAPYALAGGLFCLTALLQMKKKPEKTVEAGLAPAAGPDADEA